MKALLHFYDTISIILWLLLVMGYYFTEGNKILFFLTLIHSVGIALRYSHFYYNKKS